MVDWILCTIIGGGCTSVVLAGLYIATLTHIYRGSKFWLIIQIVALLLVSTVAQALVFFCDYIIFYMNKPSMLSIIVLGVSGAICNGAFCVAHHQLAW